MNLLKFFPLLILSGFCLVKQSQGQGFLKADNTRIVNEKGENVLLRGIGLGGWMLQEGYMLHLNKEGQQYRIKQRIASLIGENKISEISLERSQFLVEAGQTQARFRTKQQAQTT